MKIAMVSEHASPLASLGGADAGGQNVHVAALARAMAERGHDVTVHTRRDDPALPPRVEVAEGYAVEHVPAGPPRAIPKDELGPWLGDFARHLHDRWVLDRPDVVHAHFWMSGVVSVEAAGRLGIPVAQTFHALGSVKRRYQGRADTSPAHRIACEARLLRHVDQVVATCHDEVAELRRLGASPGKVSVIPCGVDLERFRPDGPVAVAGPAFRLVSVGRLVPRKGVVDIVAALAGVPEAELLVIGGPAPPDLDGDADVALLRAAATRHRVGERVRFVGRLAQHELPAVLRSAGAVVAVPWYEPFGIVPLEAMACAVPAIVSAVGGLRESVVDGVTGMHVPPRDPVALAAALNRLTGDRPWGRRLGAAGLRRAQRLYNWATIAQDTERIYTRLAGAGKRRSARPRPLVAPAGGTRR